MATLVMQGGRENSAERNAVASNNKGGLGLIRGMVLLFVTTGACELVLIGAHTIMARVLGH